MHAYGQEVEPYTRCFGYGELLELMDRVTKTVYKEPLCALKFQVGV